MKLVSLVQAKQEMRNRYLAGESVPSVAKGFGVSARDIYYHLGKLSAQEKGLHAQNSSLKQTLRKEKHGKNKSTKSQRAKVAAGLADFE